jgi:hypothetical protein
MTHTRIRPVENEGKVKLRKDTKSKERSGKPPPSALRLGRRQGITCSPLGLQLEARPV